MLWNAGTDNSSPDENEKIEPYTMQSEMLTANSEHSKERVEHIQYVR